MDLIQALRSLAAVDEEWDDKARTYQAARERLSDTRSLDNRRTQHEELVQQAARTRAQLADVELELQGLQAHVAQVDKDLYGGRVTSPRELENLRRDSELLKAHVAQLEDQGLSLISTLDELDARVKAGAESLASFEAEWEQGTADARDTYQTLRARLQELQSQRDELREGVAHRALALYDELRRTKGGRALAPMRDGVCQVCRVAVPRNKATIAESSADEIATCAGCGRILYLA